MRKSDPEAVERLRERIKAGDTLYTTVKHVSRSGMSRSIDVIRIIDGEPFHISYNVALALGDSYDRDREAVKISGCGMDMGFELVYCLSHALFPDGFDCTGKNCHSNDHSNACKAPEGACTDYFERCTNLECVPWHHGDGGYALRQRWL